MTRLLVVVLSMLCCLSVRADERILEEPTGDHRQKDGGQAFSENHGALRSVARGDATRP